MYNTALVVPRLEKHVVWSTAEGSGDPSEENPEQVTDANIEILYVARGLRKNWLANATFWLPGLSTQRQSGTLWLTEFASWNEASMRDRDLSAVVRTVLSLKILIASDELHATMEWFQALEALDKTSELGSIEEGWTRPIGSERVRDFDLFEFDLYRIHSVISRALSKSKGTVADAICSKQDCFPINSTSSAPGPITGGSSSHA